MYDESDLKFSQHIRNPHQRIRDKRHITKIHTPTSGERRLGRDIEPDPELLDQYDNFYQTTKSLLVLFQIMGVMPIERSHLGKTTFRYFLESLRQ